MKNRKNRHACSHDVCVCGGIWTGPITTDRELRHGNGCCRAGWCLLLKWVSRKSYDPAGTEVRCEACLSDGFQRTKALSLHETAASSDRASQNVDNCDAISAMATCSMRVSDWKSSYRQGFRRLHCLGNESVTVAVHSYRRAQWEWSYPDYKDVIYQWNTVYEAAQLSIISKAWYGKYTSVSKEMMYILKVFKRSIRRIFKIILNIILTFYKYHGKISYNFI